MSETIVIERTPAAEWVRCRHYIESALDRSLGLETIEDVEDAIRQEKLQFWPGRNSALTTEVVQYPQKRVLIVQHAGGDMDELIAMEPSIEAFARTAECDLIAGYGRIGWKRIWERRGYSFGWVAMVKYLRN